MIAVLTEMKDFHTGDVRGYGVEVHVDSSVINCVKQLEGLLEKVTKEKLKYRSSFLNFMRIQIRGSGKNTDTM